MHRDTWAALYGENGADVTVEAASRPPSRDHASHTPAGQRMHCVKLMGQSLMAKDFDRQVAEIEIRIAVLNRYTVLGIPVIEAVG